ncbi:MAG TPA: cytochrome c peroxidase [Pseudomonadales bacterium]
MRPHTAIRPPLGWLLAALLGSAAAATAGVDVGAGDVREGYERADYRTRSSALTSPTGDGLDLASRAQTPPLGLPPLPGSLPPLRAEAVALGRALFFDRRLSANGTLSCGMCHVPEQGFTQNELRTPVGLEGRTVRRNAPSLYNVAYRPLLFHDGRETRLENQIWSPLTAPNEMGNADRAAVLARLAGLDDYAERFATIYEAGLTAETLGDALASYERSLLSGDSPFDRWYYGNDPAALTEEAKRGFEVFRSAGCSSCHTVGEQHARFTDDGFHNTGIGHRAAATKPPSRIQLAPGVFTDLTVTFDVPRLADDGRFEVTGVEADRHRYRTPTLRNVAVTAPYMHDGSIPTLAAVVDYYDNGGAGVPGQDSRIRSLNLSAADKTALVAFLRSLTSSDVNALAADARSIAIGDHR